MSKSFVVELEDVIEHVSDWAVKLIEDAIQILTMGDRPFDTVVLSNEEAADEYATALRGNPEAWFNYIENIAQGLIGKLKASGMADDKIYSLHPYDLAFRMAADHSLKMEKVLNARL